MAFGGGLVGGIPARALARSLWDNEKEAQHQGVPGLSSKVSAGGSAEHILLSQAARLRFIVRLAAIRGGATPGRSGGGGDSQAPRPFCTPARGRPSPSRLPGHGRSRRDDLT